MSVEYSNLEAYAHMRPVETGLPRVSEREIGAMAFLLARRDALTRTDPDARPLLQPEAIGPTLMAARGFAASMPEDRFWQALLAAGPNMPRVAQAITDLERVDEILQSDAANADHVDFLIATSTMDDPAPILEEFSDPKSVIDQAEATAFRDELLTFSEEDSEKETNDGAPDQPHTLDDVIDEAIKRVGEAGIEDYASASIVLGLFPELRSDLTQLPRNRGKNGRMEVSRDDIVRLLVLRNSRDLNVTRKEISKRIG